MTTMREWNNDKITEKLIPLDCKLLKKKLSSRKCLTEAGKSAKWDTKGSRRESMYVAY